MTEKLAVDIQWARGEFQLQIRHDFTLQGTTAVFGPSGSGKTTLLRLIAGLQQPDAGKISCGDKVWFQTEDTWKRPVKNLRPADRKAVLVFQEPRLFPHMTVEKNLDFAFKRRSLSGPQVIRGDVLDALDLEPLLKRQPTALSGGEKQRVSLGRALLSNPGLLMLDEPLSALDAKRKQQILPYLQNIVQGFEVPIIYVTHALAEVEALADRAVIIEEGCIIASGGIDILPQQFLHSGRRVSGKGVIKLSGKVVEAPGKDGYTTILIDDWHARILRPDVKLHDLVDVEFDLSRGKIVD